MDYPAADHRSGRGLALPSSQHLASSRSSSWGALNSWRHDRDFQEEYDSPSWREDWRREHRQQDYWRDDRAAWREDRDWRDREDKGRVEDDADDDGEVWVDEGDPEGREKEGSWAERGKGEGQANGAGRGGRGRGQPGAGGVGFSAVVLETMRKERGVSRGIVYIIQAMAILLCCYSEYDTEVFLNADLNTEQKL